jgi:hypothetical protein
MRLLSSSDTQRTTIAPSSLLHHAHQQRAPPFSVVPAPVFRLYQSRHQNL